ncbi:MAG: MBL fold metallo-hydrolase [Desulfobulbaceae bacterium]|nr:MBL fold metallo-hydrolase [Desulfobulbaceae bacterium]
MSRFFSWLPSIVFAVLLCLFSSAFGRGPMLKLSERTHAYLDEPSPLETNSFGANAGMIIGDDGVAVIDALGSTEEAQAFLSEIRALTDKPIRYLILTHHHKDHSGGASVFKAAGAEIIAHADCSEELSGPGIVLPDKIFSGQTMELPLKGVTIRLLAATPSHSRGSIIVHLPEEKTLFSGDLLFTDYHPYLGEGDIVAWRAKLDEAVGLEAEKIVPGHGPLSSNRDLMEMKSYLAQFDTLATEIVSHGKNIDQAYRALVTTLPKRSRSESLIMSSLRMKYFSSNDNRTPQK